MQTKDRNNFINLILMKIELAKNFHQKVNLSITSKAILNCAVLKFYLRKRYNKLYLYTRLDKAKFGSRSGAHDLILDINDLIPSATIESVQGHYKGWLIEINEDTKDDLIKLLKIISLMAHPEDFYLKSAKSFKCYWNYKNASSTPIHLAFTEKQTLNLRCADLIYLLHIGVKKFDRTRFTSDDLFSIPTDINSNITNNTSITKSSN